MVNEVLQGELASVKELGFAFRRAASRLHEMASAEYYDQWQQLQQQ
jgi:predicted ATPase